MLNSQDSATGVSARSLLIAGYVVIAPAAALLVASGLNLIVAGMTFTFAAHPVIGYGGLAVFVVSIATSVSLIQGAFRRLRQEMSHGYVTLPYDYRNFELRDPRSGAVLRAKGVPGGSNPLAVSLRRWR